jgi:hypothetical protein
MVEHWNQAGRADPEQIVTVMNLVEKLIGEKSYEAIIEKIEDLILDPGIGQKTRKERQRREDETGVSISEAIGAFLKELEGVNLKPLEVFALGFKKSIPPVALGD